jgi:hypothetical protein
MFMLLSPRCGFVIFVYAITTPTKSQKAKTKRRFLVLSVKSKKQDGYPEVPVCSANPSGVCCFLLVFSLVPYGACAKSQGMKQLMAGGGVALVGFVLIPLLSGLFG